MIEAILASVSELLDRDVVLCHALLTITKNLCISFSSMLHYGSAITCIMFIAAADSCLLLLSPYRAGIAGYRSQEFDS